MTLALVAAWCATAPAADLTHDYPLCPVPFTAVKVDDGFWLPRLETNRKVTVRYDFQKCEETGRLSNFTKAAGRMEGEFEGIPFNDSDVYKVIEGAAYALALHPDPELDVYLDKLIDDIAAAQEDDGYLYTARTLGANSNFTGPKRWSNLRTNHELYNVGHMYEAAVAHYQATGKRTLLDVAIKNADLIDRVFGPGKRCDVPGHEEIEIGLAKLYRATGEKRYLNLAKFFLDVRGRSDLRKLYGAYCQDHKPVTQQTKAVGHSVRAGYLYAGMADIAALTGDQAYVKAIDAIWQDVVSTKLYLTGGIGARHGGEAFGDAYELPNATAYNETCAAIANALWNHRLFLLHGDAKYLDVLERIIYNGFLSGIALSGDRFFYPNPLASDGNHQRQAWFGCSCCPVNVVRFIPSLPGYVYAHRDDTLFVNLFFDSAGTVPMDRGAVRVTQQTRYPWEGAVRIAVEPEEPGEFAIAIRMPGWARNQPAPSDLYRYASELKKRPSLTVNGKPLGVEMRDGFAIVRREWQGGDTIELDLPLRVRRVICHPNVEGNVGRVALERGPIVYCAEAVDNAGRVSHLVLPDDAKLQTSFRPDLLGGIVTLEGEALALSKSGDGASVVETPHKLVAIPYYAWAHRDSGEMAVWLARDPARARPIPAPTIASTSTAAASHCWHMDATRALNDQVEPENSNDHSLPRLTWWDHRGTTEWVQYDFAEPTIVSSVEVYWFDDTGRGACRVPKSWRLLYRDGQEWKPVANASAYGVEKDQYNSVTFDSVKTSGLRLEVELQPEVSGGILEWKVE